MKSVARIVTALTCIALLTSALSAQSGLSSSQRRQIDRALKIIKNGGDDEKATAMRQVAIHGEAANRYLAKIAQKNPDRGEVFEAIRKLDWLFGKDLATKDVTARAEPWTLWAVPAGEVVLFKGLGLWIGVQIHEDYDPSTGTIHITTATSTDKVLPLGGPGVLRAVHAVTGKAVVLESRQFAFPPRHYTLKMPGADIGIRSIGSGAFRFGLHPGTLPVARTGMSNLHRVRPTMKGLIWRDRADEILAKDLRRTQQYLFRIIDGGQPLPTYGTDDEARFARTEQVRVEMRQEDNGKRVLLVAFPHADEAIAYDTTTHALLLAFVDRMFKIGQKQLLVWIGKNEAHEANWFYDNGRWRRPSGILAKRIRALFPEDY
ncbi:MAG: hypothetical protein HRU14_03435 [Planctomycetes bacterium]|nr:hypothetical protein [Planctomycetota bacterium]